MVHVTKDSKNELVFICFVCRVKCYCIAKQFIIINRNGICQELVKKICLRHFGKKWLPLGRRKAKKKQWNTIWEKTCKITRMWRWKNRKKNRVLSNSQTCWWLNWHLPALIWRLFLRGLYKLVCVKEKLEKPLEFIATYENCYDRAIWEEFSDLRRSRHVCLYDNSPPNN